MMFNIPNLFTLANLLSGTIGILYISQNGPDKAIYFVLAGGFFDFFDGFLARRLKVNSLIGKELDSLADMVTFGVLPGMTMFYMIQATTDNLYLPYIGFLITAFSALRLAKFNVDERQSDTFYGLNTPANTMFITGLPFVSLAFLHTLPALITLTVIFSGLLIMDVKMFALKFKSLGWKENQWKFLALIAAGVSIVIFGIAAIPFIILSYILFSFIPVKK